MERIICLTQYKVEEIYQSLDISVLGYLKNNLLMLFQKQ